MSPVGRGIRVRLCAKVFESAAVAFQSTAASPSTTYLTRVAHRVLLLLVGIAAAIGCREGSPGGGAAASVRDSATMPAADAGGLGGSNFAPGWSPVAGFAGVSTGSSVHTAAVPVRRSASTAYNSKYLKRQKCPSDPLHSSEVYPDLAFRTYSAPCDPLGAGTRTAEAGFPRRWYS
jgi:hypothetical protein